MTVRTSVKQKAVCVVFLVLLAVVCITMSRGRERVLNILSHNSYQKNYNIPPVSLFDGQIRDCTTKELRSAGVVGVVKIIDFPSTFVGWKGNEVSPEEDRNKSQEAFVKIYKDKIWEDDKTKQLAASGPGSTLDYATEAMAGIHSIINEIKAKLGLDRIRLLDIPCGDMRWMSRFLENREDVDYTGIDIVPDIISSHKKSFSDKPWTFVHRDIIQAGLGGRYHLVFSRQMLQHLLYRDVLQFLLEVSRSGSSYLLVTSFPSTSVNSELNHNELGRFRLLNLEAPPIMLAPPLCYYRDGPKPNQRHALLLYPLPLRQVVDCNVTRAMKLLPSRSKLDSYYSCGNWSV